jgi:HAD superfamily hydrolase (TIGR01493 family)
MYNGLQPLVSQLDEKPTRSQILTQLGTIELALQAEHPTMLYSEVLSHAYERLAQNLNGESGPSLQIRPYLMNQWKSVEATKEECVAFSQSIKDWPVFPDSSDALAELSKHYKLVVLSNVDRTSFAFTREKLEAGKFTFDQICTAQDIGSYKPDPANFLHALKVIRDNYGIEKDQVLSTAQVPSDASMAVR